MKLKIFPFCLSALALVASGTVMADNDFYLGARAGSALNDRFDNTASNVDSDNAYSFNGGWNFNEHWGLELGYIEPGDLHADAVADAGFDLDGSMVTAGVTYRMPLANNFELLSGVGAFDLNEDGTLTTIAGPVPVSNDDSGVYVEVGARYRFDGPIALRASYQWFDFDSNGDGTPWIGIEFGF